MGYVEFFEMNSNGAGWKNLSGLPVGDVIEMEFELSTKPTVQLLCAFCLVPIPSGSGNACGKHKQLSTTVIHSLWITARA